MGCKLLRRQGRQKCPFYFCKLCWKEVIFLLVDYLPYSLLRYANRRNASKEAFASPTKDVLGDILGRSAMLSLIDQPANKHEKEPKVR